MRRFLIMLIATAAIHPGNCRGCYFGDPLFFYLIAGAGPTKTQSVTLLVPLFGMITGVIVILGSIFLIYNIRFHFPL